MSGVGVLIACCIVNIASAFFCAWLALEKGRDGVNWFFLGLLVGPIALITLVGAPIRAKEPNDKDPNDIDEVERRRHEFEARRQDIEEQLRG